MPHGIRPREVRSRVDHGPDEPGVAVANGRRGRGVPREGRRVVRVEEPPGREIGRADGVGPHAVRRHGGVGVGGQQRAPEAGRGQGGQGPGVAPLQQLGGQRRRWSHRPQPLVLSKAGAGVEDVGHGGPRPAGHGGQVADPIHQTARGESPECPGGRGQRAGATAGDTDPGQRGAEAVRITLGRHGRSVATPRASPDLHRVGIPACVLDQGSSGYSSVNGSGSGIRVPVRWTADRA